MVKTHAITIARYMQVGEVGPDWFTVYLIPETLRVTVLGSKQQGDTVNLEIEAQTQVYPDILVSSLLASASSQTAGPTVCLAHAILCVYDLNQQYKLKQVQLPSSITNVTASWHSFGESPYCECLVCTAYSQFDTCWDAAGYSRHGGEGCTTVYAAKRCVSSLDVSVFALSILAKSYLVCFLLLYSDIGV